MPKAVRPFAARIAFEDKTRLAVAQALDRREDLDLARVSRDVLGRNHAYLFQYLFKRTPRVLDYADAVKLARFLALDPAVFLDAAARMPRLSEHLPVAAGAAPENDTVPLRGTAQGPGGALRLGGEAEIGAAPRHPAQKGMKDAFAFYATDDSMAPRYRAGEMVYAVAHKPPARGQDCLVELKNGAGYLRQFERRAGKDILCLQLNPSREWRRAAAQVKAVHAVVGRG
jgi:hypothetical protein